MAFRKRDTQSLNIPWYASLTTKLFGLIVLSLSLSMGVISWQQTRVLRDFLERQLEDTTLQMARDTAVQTEKFFVHWQDLMILMITRMAGATVPAYADFVVSFLRAERSISSFMVFETGGEAPAKTLLFHENLAATSPLGDRGREIADLFASFAKIDLVNQSLEIRDLKPLVGVPQLALLRSFKIEGQTTTLWAGMTIPRKVLLADAPKDQSSMVMILDRRNDIIFKSGDESLLSDELLTSIRQDVVSPHFQRGLKSLVTSDKPVLAAYDEIAVFGLKTVVLQDASGAQIAIRKTLRQTILWAWIAVLLTLLVSYLASFRITKNLKETTEVTHHIADGDFGVKTNPRGQDEVAVLSWSVNRMAKQIQDLLHARVAAAQQEKELETAKLVQETFFPPPSFEGKNIRIRGQCFPASACGGDLWGHFPFQDDIHYFFVADATGHGVSAALITSMAYIEWQAINLNMLKSGDMLTPSAILTQLNAVLYQAKQKATMTMFVGLLDFRQGKFLAANAGHFTPFLFRSGGDKVSVLPRSKGSPGNNTQIGVLRRGDVVPEEKGLYKVLCRGAPLGFLPHSDYELDVFPLKRHDKIICFTDGLFECTNPEGKAWGERNLRKSLLEIADQDIDTVHQGISQSAFQHFADHPRRDDITLVILEAMHKTEAKDESPSSAYRLTS